MPDPLEPSVTVTRLPQGACRFRCSVSAASAALGSASGANRTLTLARALAASVLDASATLGASIPITVAVGLVHNRPGDRPPPEQPHVVQQAGLVA